MPLETVPIREVQTRIKMKKDFDINWETNNPILLDGEMIFVVTSSGDTRTKVGNGINRYNDLPFTDEKLPKVNTSDEGKFLIVRGGTWVAEEVPFAVIYAGDVEPTNDLGDDGDLYMQVDSI